MKEPIKRLTWFHWVIAFVLAFGLSILLRAGLAELFQNNSLNPWLNATAISVKMSVAEFGSGTSGSTTYWTQTLKALIGIIIYFVIGPTLMILFGITRKESGQTGSKGISSHYTLFWIGLIITLMGIISMGIETVRDPILNQNKRKHTQLSAKKDDVRQNLMILGLQSYEYLILPSNEGGDNGSFKGLSIEDLPAYSDIETGTYQFLDTPSDTLLRIRGSMYAPASYEGPVEMTHTVEVRPSKMIHWLD